MRAPVRLPSRRLAELGKATTLPGIKARGGHSRSWNAFGPGDLVYSILGRNGAGSTAASISIRVDEGGSGRFRPIGSLNR